MSLAPVASSLSLTRAPPAIPTSSIARRLCSRLKLGPKRTNRLHAEEALGHGTLRCIPRGGRARIGNHDAQRQVCAPVAAGEVETLLDLIQGRRVARPRERGAAAERVSADHGASQAVVAVSRVRAGLILLEVAHAIAVGIGVGVHTK